MKKTEKLVDDQPLFTLLLIRHGETQYNKEGRFYGSIDAPVNENGRLQAHALADRLKAWQIDAAFSSPMIRAKETAVIGLTHHNIDIALDPLLVEMDHGNWEGLRFDEARDLDSAIWNDWRSGKIEKPHTGESIHDVTKRAKAFLAKLPKQFSDNETIAVFAHGGVLQMLLCALLDTQPRPLWQFRYRNCTVAEVAVFPRGGVLVSFG